MMSVIAAFFLGALWGGLWMIVLCLFIARRGE